MKAELLKEKETPLLQRKRMNFMVDFAGSTPSGIELRESLSKQLKVDKNLIAIRHIYQRYGLPRAKVIVHVYKNFEILKKLEQLSKKALEEYVVKEEVKSEETPKVEEKVEVKAETPKETEGKPVEDKEDGKEENKE